MIRRAVKLIFYIKAPFKAFVLFHPIKAARLWVAYILGSAVFGSRRRAQTAAAAEPSGWGETARPQGPGPVRAAGSISRPAGGNGDAPSGVPAGASVAEGHESA